MDSDETDLIETSAYSPDIVSDAAIENQNQRTRRFFPLEPAILLFFFGWNLCGTILTNQILIQTCSAVYKFNESDCLKLGLDNETDDVKVTI